LFSFAPRVHLEIFKKSLNSLMVLLKCIDTEIPLCIVNLLISFHHCVSGLILNVSSWLFKNWIDVLLKVFHELNWCSIQSFWTVVSCFLLVWSKNWTYPPWVLSGANLLVYPIVYASNVLSACYKHKYSKFLLF